MKQTKWKVEVDQQRRNPPCVLFLQLDPLSQGDPVNYKLQYY